MLKEEFLNATKERGGHVDDEEEESGVDGEKTWLEKEDAVVREKRAEKDLLFPLLIIRTKQLTE